MTAWSIDYARSLTKDQWHDEIKRRFLDDITREIESSPFREPLRSVLEQLDVDFQGEHAFPVWNWDIYTVSTFEENSLLRFTAWFYAGTSPWHQAEIDPESIWFDEYEDGSKTFLIAFDGILRIRNTGTLSSEIVEIYTDPDLMPVLYDRGDDFIFGVQNGC
jgi:hypothetical protein